MNEPADGASEFTSPAESSLHGQLAVLREDPPSARGDLTAHVSRTLRWQALLVVPVTAALALAGGVVEGVRALVDGRAR